MLRAGVGVPGCQLICLVPGSPTCSWVSLSSTLLNSHFLHLTSDAAVLVGRQATGRGWGARRVAPSGSMPCTQWAQWVSCSTPRCFGSWGSFAWEAFPCGFRKREDGPKPHSRALNGALQDIRPSSGVSWELLQGVGEFVLLLAQIPLAVVQLNAPSEGLGRDFPQSCLKAEELWVAFAVCSPPCLAVCVFCHPPTARERPPWAGKGCGCWGGTGETPKHY